MNNVVKSETKESLPADQTLRSIEDIIADPSNPVNPRRLKTRKQGGKQITYLPWYQAVKAAPGCSGRLVCWAHDLPVLRPCLPLGSYVPGTLRFTGDGGDIIVSMT